MKEYKSHVFDLDGVLLATNKSKSDAFYRAALPHGEEAAIAMVEFHKNAGSISRRQRWQHFFHNILDRDPIAGELDDIVETCTQYVLDGIGEAQEVKGARKYLETIKGSKSVLSGVDTSELNMILDLHGLRPFFESITGGPPSKNINLSRLVLWGTIETPAVYYGDTLDDYECARANGLDFVFIASDSEFKDYEGYFSDHPDVIVAQDFTDLMGPRAHNLARVVARVGANGYAHVRGEDVYVGVAMAGAEVTF